MLGKPSSKSQRKADELFQFYTETMVANGLHPVGQVSPFIVNQISEALESVSLIEFKEAIEFAIKNWERLAMHDSDGAKLDPHPNFFQMVAPWRAKKWLDFSRVGFPTKTERENKKLSIKEYEQKMNLEIWKKSEVWNKLI